MKGRTLFLYNNRLFKSISGQSFQEKTEIIPFFDIMSSRLSINDKKKSHLEIVW